MIILSVVTGVKDALAALAGDLCVGRGEGEHGAGTHYHGKALGADVAKGAHIVAHEKHLIYRNYSSYYTTADFSCTENFR
jgi:hypothetical protein